MAPGSEEERMVETLWAASERVHEEDRRREVCNLWIDYHEHLCGVFRSHANHHERRIR
ncbi:MAG TPA: hypothetical protein VNA27_12475 [Rubrobacteraceae bacterium]|nr:hypothetical protein [Rubrobacteraceae bacterium]